MSIGFNRRFAVLLALSGLLLAACSLGQSRQTGSGSSPLGDAGTAGGPCKNVEICSLIPQSQVNSSLGVTAMFTSPDTPTNMGGMASDHLPYHPGASDVAKRVHCRRSSTGTARPHAQPLKRRLARPYH